jgi:hypothetical protein
LGQVSHKPQLSAPPPPAWTRPVHYLDALAPKPTARHRARRERQRTEPDAPRLLLSTLPFLMLIALLGVLTVGIMIIAYPGNQPPPAQPKLAAAEQGYAPKGWMQEAQKDMRRQRNLRD